MELAGAVISLIVVVFAAWVKWETGKDSTYDDLQIGRQDIESGNVDAVEQRIDRVLAESGDSIASKPNDEDTRRRLQELL